MPVHLGEVTCCVCGTEVPRVNWNQVTCGSARCQNKIKLRSVVARENNRKRNRAWAEIHRNVHSHNPWLLGAPPYETHLPGGGMELEFHPAPKWPLLHRNIQGLHGVITSLLAVPHENVPVFSLIPWPRGCGWGVYVRTDAWLTLANKRYPVRLFEQRLEACFSPLRRLKAPLVSTRGHQKVRISTVTPVSTGNDGHKNTHLRPTSGNIKSTLVRHMSPRLGLYLPQENVCVEVVRQETESEYIPIGGKFGNLYGWVGMVELEVNAVARWLLEVSSMIGLGGRTSLGFGRIRLIG